MAHFEPFQFHPQIPHILAFSNLFCMEQPRTISTLESTDPQLFITRKLFILYPASLDYFSMQRVFLLLAIVKFSLHPVLLEIEKEKE